MPYSRSVIRAVSGAALLFSLPASAEGTQSWAAETFPLPRAILPDLDEAAMTPAIQLGDGAAEAVSFEPDLSVIGRRTANADLHAQARGPVPVDIIRKGFSARSGATGPEPERAVGFKLGAETFSLSTTLVRPESDAPGSDARIAWRAARPLAGTGSDVVWTVSTGGGGSLLGAPEQNGSMLLAYRHHLFKHLSLTPQISVDGNYVFASGDGLHSSLTSQVKLSADLAAIAALPWEASLDVTLARRMPLVASDLQTAGTAMLKLKYTLD